MIRLELSQLVAYYILFFIVIFLGGWVFACCRKEKDAAYTKEFRFWQCFVCAFVYSSMFDESMTVCPQCGSYNKKEVET